MSEKRITNSKNNWHIVLIFLISFLILIAIAFFTYYQTHNSEIVSIIIIGDVISFSLLLFSFTILFRQIKQKNQVAEALEKSRVELKKHRDGLEHKIKERTSELKESEEKFRILSERSLVGVYISQAGAFIYSNPALCTIFGYVKEEMVGKTFYDIVFQEDLSKLKERNDSLFDKSVESVYHQIRGVKKSGDIVYLETYKSLITYKGNVAILGSIIDITERQEMEKRLKDKRNQLESLNRNLEKRINEEIIKRREKEQMLIQQSKVAAMGEMIGAISHQWRQPINALYLLLENMKKAFDYNKLDEEYFSSALKRAGLQIDFMSRTIDDFRNFFKSFKEKETFNIVLSLKETLSILNAQLKNNFIDIDFDSNANLNLTTHNYPNEFKQVLMNIINNASDAIKEKRESSGKKNEREVIYIRVLQNDHNIFIQIEDTGNGVPEEIKERVFEPYFTTKEQGRGTGIGLYMSKTIVENNMGGRLYLENIVQEDKEVCGAVFTIELEKE